MTEDRITAAKKMVSRVAKVTTRLDPDGIKLRFFNFKGDGDFNNIQTEEKVKENFKKCGIEGLYSMIGTSLRSKILEPFLFAKIEKKILMRPLLITIITDGEVWIEIYLTQSRDLLKHGIGQG